jgi:hypothetical protein
MKAYTRITILVIFIFNIFVVAHFVRCENKIPDNLTYGILGSLFNTVNLRDAQIAMEVWLNEVNKVSKIASKSKAIVLPDPPTLRLLRNTS